LQADGESPRPDFFAHGRVAAGAHHHTGFYAQSHALRFTRVNDGDACTSLCLPSRKLISLNTDPVPTVYIAPMPEMAASIFLKKDNE
jgi:hypothetical protein